MPVTQTLLNKKDFLAQAGSNQGADLYNTSQKLGYSAQDVDSIMGYSPGTSQDWVSQNIKAPTGGQSANGGVKVESYLDNPPKLDNVQATNNGFTWGKNDRITDTKSLGQWAGHSFQDDNQYDAGELAAALRGAQGAGITPQQFLQSITNPQQAEAQIRQMFPNTWAQWLDTGSTAAVDNTHKYWIQDQGDYNGAAPGKGTPPSAPASVCAGRAILNNRTSSPCGGCRRPR